MTLKADSSGDFGLEKGDKKPLFKGGKTKDAISLKKGQKLYIKVSEPVGGSVAYFFDVRHWNVNNPD